MEKVERKKQEKNLNNFISDFSKLRENGAKYREELKASIKIKDNNTSNTRSFKV
jgi:hypothetical protein